MDTSDFSKWRKSSYNNGGGECVELAWRKSSRSDHQGNCVEIAQSGVRTGVRDSKNPDGPILTFPASALATFLGRC